MTDDAEPLDPAAEVEGEAVLEEMAATHSTPATESATRRLTGLARTNSQIHANPRPGVLSGHGQSISGRAVRRGDMIFRGLAAGSGGFLLVIMAAIAIFLVWKAAPGHHRSQQRQPVHHAVLELPFRRSE